MDGVWEVSNNGFCLDKKVQYMIAATWKEVNGEREVGDVKEMEGLGLDKRDSSFLWTLKDKRIGMAQKALAIYFPLVLFL